MSSATLAAYGGPKTITQAGPHYRWPYLDRSFDDAVIAQVHRSLSDRDASGVIGELETLFAAFAGAPHAVAFSSGTAAIHAMSRVAGLKAGDAIIAPAYTFFATASPFAFDGVQVRFADCNEYGNVTAATLAAQLTADVRAVIVTHMWGNPCPMDDIAEFCRSNGLLLFEDCSHAHFASWRGQRVGTFGDMAAWSLNQKAITSGEGGMFTTANPRLRDLAVLYGHYHKRAQRELHPDREYAPFALTGMGLKQRTHTPSAAIGVHQLQRADDIERRRRAVLEQLQNALSGNPVLTPIVVPTDAGQHGLYVAGLHFHPDNATVSRDDFVQLCTAEGATEVDAPGSTGNISGQPLFARTDPHRPWRVDAEHPSLNLPGVTTFERTFLKIPLWGYPGDEEIIDGYLATLTKVSAAVAR
jgi:perosamine synthetase